MEASTPNPLNSISEAPSLDELFSRDPLQLSDTDLERIIETLRTQRTAWVKEAKEAKAKGKSIPNKMTREQAANALKNLTLDI